MAAGMSTAVQATDPGTGDGTAPLETPNFPIPLQFITLSPFPVVESRNLRRLASPACEEVLA